MEKYYTPTIEEFHKGFEYEYYKNYNWYPATGATHCMVTVEWCLNRGRIRGYKGYDDYRVKYLDNKDIESILPKASFVTGYIENISYKLHLDTEVNPHYINYSFNTHELLITHTDGNRPFNLFKGIINNKSELKRLIKQLNLFDNE